MPTSRIVLIDDSKFALSFMTRTLRESPEYEVIPFGRADEAIAYITAQPDLSLICTDLNMPGLSGFEVVAKLQELKVVVPVIVITGSDDLADALKAIRLGAFDYIVKPVDKEQLAVSVTRAIKVSRLERDNRTYVRLLETINERNRKELEMGSRIQRHLLPKEFPTLEHFRFGRKYVPSNSIGGDFFGLIDYGDPSSAAVFFLDVTGHGIPAALMAAFIQSEINATIRGGDRLVNEIKTLNDRLNRTLLGGNFASTFFLVLSDTDRMISYCQCSQEPLLLFRPDGAVETLQTGGVLLGSFGSDLMSDEELGFEVKTRFLESGDRLVLYTDGLTEAPNAAGEQFSLARMIATIRAHAPLPAQELCERMYATVSAFADGKELNDDFTILIVDVL